MSDRPGGQAPALSLLERLSDPLGVSAESWAGWPSGPIVTVLTKLVPPPKPAPG